MNRVLLIRWVRRLVFALAGSVLLLLLVVVPIGTSFLITNSRFRFPERGSQRPQDKGLEVSYVEFQSRDGVPLRGWWSAGDPERPVIIFCHGLNRSRLELLERAAASNQRGYGVLLFDMRNHGESGNALTTLGIHERRDVCAAQEFVHERAGRRPQVLWGVSMGASTALLAAKECRGSAAIVADSAFLSFRDTIAHHFRLIFKIPSFPIANLIVLVTSFRVGFDPDEGDVEAAVRDVDVPILFIAGGEDRRMPPELAVRMMSGAKSPDKELLIVPGAGHGNAYETDPALYLNSVYRFLGKLRYNPAAF